MTGAKRWWVAGFLSLTANRFSFWLCMALYGSVWLWLFMRVYGVKPKH